MEIDEPVIIEIRKRQCPCEPIKKCSQVGRINHTVLICVRLVGYEQYRVKQSIAALSGPANPSVGIDGVGPGNLPITPCGKEPIEGCGQAVAVEVYANRTVICYFVTHRCPNLG